jgi:hypothetical protein
MVIEIFLKHDGTSDIEVNKELLGRDLDRPELLVREIPRAPPPPV